MDKRTEEKHAWVILAILTIALIAFMWVCTGCQLMAGACRDIESAARYGHEHLSVDE